jgi:hypothetical protein
MNFINDSLLPSFWTQLLCQRAQALEFSNNPQDGGLRQEGGLSFFLVNGYASRTLAKPNYSHRVLSTIVDEQRMFVGC